LIYNELKRKKSPSKKSPIKAKDFEEKTNPFIHEIIETGIKVA